MIYLDAAAGVAPLEAVRTAVRAELAAWRGCARRRLAAARERAAAALGVAPSRLAWTSGATEANALAVGLALGAAPAGPRRVVTQPTEHPSLLAPLDALAAAGAIELELLPVSAQGVVDPAALAAALERPAALVSIMAANHETGVLQPLEALAPLCRAAGVPLHVDAAQLPSPRAAIAAGAELVALSGYKLGGPKGVGLLVTAPGAGPPGAARPGPAAAAGLAVALERARDRPPADLLALAVSRDALQAELLAAVPGAQVNGGEAPRLPGHLNLSLRGLSGEALVLDLDARGVVASSGAACATGSGAPSPVLLALGRSRQLAAGSLRLSLPAPLAAPERARVVAAVAEAAARLRALA